MFFVLYSQLDIDMFIENWFSLVSLFNHISTFVGYLMPKSSLKNSMVLFNSLQGDKRFMPFQRVLVWKWMW